MSARTQLGLAILVAAAALGIAGDLLLRGLPWGLNLSLVVAGLVGAGALLVRRFGIPLSAEAPWLGVTALLLAVAFVRRASPALQALDVVALLVVLGLAVAARHGARLRALGVVDYGHALVTALARVVAGPFRLVNREIRWTELPQTGRLAQARAVALGVVLAVPLLLVFGGLFASADVVFASIARAVLDVEIEPTLSHLFLMGLLGSLAAGYLTAACCASPAQVTATPGPDGPPHDGTLRLGAVPVATALGLVNLLFLVFVVIQLRYLFGGQALVLETTGLTLAEYARQGFFELLTASGLVLPLLLGADWLLRDEAAEGRRRFRRLAVLLLLLLGVVMASAGERMRLYVDAFGLSEIRLYATAFMILLAVVLAWFGWTVLRDRRGRFAYGALLQGTVALAALHVANPDALVARVNLDRLRGGARFDAAYLAAELSADAVPTLIRAAPALPRAHACELAWILLARWEGDDETDWRSWNWARTQARRLVRERRADLESVACPPRS